MFLASDSESFRKKMTFEGRPKENKGTGQVATYEKSIPSRGKDPEMGALWPCLSESEGVRSSAV